MPHEVQELDTKAVTRGPAHHYFGYYDKFPWDATGRYMLALEPPFIDRTQSPDDVAVIGRIDLENDCRWEPVSETRAWNWQQGTMLHWLPTAADRCIIHNNRDDTFFSVIRDLDTGETRRLPRPIYALSPDGKQAVTLNFARVHCTRPGYGYCAVPDPWEDDMHPAEDGIYWMDLDTGENRLVVSLAQIVEIRHDETMEDTKHWFNHLQFNTEGTRFLFLHRWREAGEKRWFTRLFTANPDGSDVCCVADHGMVSHFDWRDANHILAWATHNEMGNHFYLFTDQSDEIEMIGEDTLPADGHCSYSPNRRWILNDTYPAREDRKRTLMLYNPAENRRVDIGRFYAPPEYEGELRCDLHPRWSRDGRFVCFDSLHEGERQMYVINVSRIVET
ncbi:MAG: hypothetical protein GXP25_23905 [Planctomycetes bacterium]|nr:hypothetical protein [Planctomycetota bacterium]